MGRQYPLLAVMGCGLGCFLALGLPSEGKMGAFSASLFFLRLVDLVQILVGERGTGATRRGLLSSCLICVVDAGCLHLFLFFFKRVLAMLVRNSSWSEEDDSKVGTLMVMRGVGTTAGPMTVDDDDCDGGLEGGFAFGFFFLGTGRSSHDEWEAKASSTSAVWSMSPKMSVLSEKTKLARQLVENVGGGGFRLSVLTPSSRLSLLLLRQLEVCWNFL